MGMSIDESIEVIKHEKPERPTSLYGAMKKNAFNTAIDTMRKYQELEQEPTTKNDLGVDCVSRVDVLKLMQDNWHTHNGDWAMQESMDDIRALPSVTPQEPRKGHWIATGAYYTGAYGSIDYVECSCCHEDSLEEGNYCPNCGAKMESEG